MNRRPHGLVTGENVRLFSCWLAQDAMMTTLLGEHGDRALGIGIWDMGFGITEQRSVNEDNGPPFMIQHCPVRNRLCYGGEETHQ